MKGAFQVGAVKAALEDGFEPETSSMKQAGTIWIRAKSTGHSWAAN